MAWFQDPVPFIWGGLALAALGVILEIIKQNMK